jgi:hypothetical protein
MAPATLPERWAESLGRISGPNLWARISGPDLAAETVRRLPAHKLPTYPRAVRTQLRTSLIAGVAVVMVLTLPSLSASAAPAPRAAGASASHGFTHAHAARILDRVRSALTPGTGSPRSGPARDLTMDLRDLRLARSALTRSERATADTYLARPSVGGSCSGTIVVSAHYCLHYTAPGLFPNPNAATPEQAQVTSDTLENVWSVEIGALGFRAPPSDGDGRFDVYLQDIGSQGYYGYCSPDANTAHSTSYCVLDNDFDPAQFGGVPAINSLRVTAAHEFFHAIQFGYDTTEDIWLMEGTAVWAEEQVYGDINDYLQYLPFSAITHPETPVDYKGENAALFYRYGAVLFWKFLSGQFGDPGIVRRVWEYADGPAYSLQAVTAALAERGWSFDQAFSRFGVWNTEPPGTYDDRALYPGPVWWLAAALGRHQRDTGAHTAVLQHLTSAAALLLPAARLPKHTKVRIRVTAPALVRMPRAVVQLRRRDGTVRIVDVPLDGSGSGHVKVSFDPRAIGSVVVTLTNASTRMSSCWSDTADRFSCGGQSADDNLPFTLRARLKLPR